MSRYFIDCGAHCGESVLRAKRQFGLDTHIISFEAVPELADSLSKLYAEDDYVDVVNAAVWIKDDTIDINICPAFTDGSSILRTLNDNHLAKTVKVPCVDISSWIKNSFSAEDYIILKLDIEGAEYSVLEKMYEDGTLSMVNELWGEWHYGHIVNNIHGEELKKLNDQVLRVDKILKDCNKVFNIWEAYYEDGSPYLTKRPKNLNG